MMIWKNCACEPCGDIHMDHPRNDPTANTAIGNIMREERMKQKKAKRKNEAAPRKRYPKVGVWHAKG